MIQLESIARTAYAPMTYLSCQLFLSASIAGVPFGNIYRAWIQFELKQKKSSCNDHMNKHKTILQQFSYKGAYLVLTTYLLIQIITAIGFSQDGASKSGLTYRSNIPELDTRANIEIDPTTLGLNIIIPLVNLPGRGINMPINMRYSSKVWKIRHSFHWPDPQDPNQILLHADYAGGSTAGWITTIRTPKFSQGGGDSEPYIVRFEHTPPNPPTYRDTGFPDDGKPWDNSLPPHSSETTLPLQYVKNNMLIQMPDQSVHELRVSDQLHNQLSNTYRGPAYAVDSSRMKFDIDTQILYLADGSRYDVFVPPDATVRYIDRNGNTLTYSNSFHGTTQEQWQLAAADTFRAAGRRWWGFPCK